MSIPPPQGLTEVDYEAIEAAVTETVRGRWFLNEFARRNRTAEMRLLMEAMERLETRIDTRLDAPSADPSVRMLIQRIKEIAAHLDGLSEDMREEGVEDRFVESVALQARAVSGMMRGAPVPRMVAAAGVVSESPPRDPKPQEPPPQPVVRMPRADLPASFAAPAAGQPDPRLVALSGLDGLTLAKKLAVFS